MKRTCKVNGKVSYPQNDGVLTTLQEETDELNYGDTVTLEIKKAEVSE